MRLIQVIGFCLNVPHHMNLPFCLLAEAFCDRLGFTDAGRLSENCGSCERTRPPGLALLFQIATHSLCHMAAKTKRFSPRTGQIDIMFPSPHHISAGWYKRCEAKRPLRLQATVNVVDWMNRAGCCVGKRANLGRKRVSVFPN